MSNGLYDHKLSKTKFNWADHIRLKIKVIQLNWNPLNPKFDGLNPFGHRLLINNKKLGFSNFGKKQYFSFLALSSRVSFKTAKLHFPPNHKIMLFCQNRKISFSHQNSIITFSHQNRKITFFYRSHKITFSTKTTKSCFPAKTINHIFPPKPQNHVFSPKP